MTILTEEPTARESLASPETGSVPVDGPAHRGAVQPEAAA
jgi:hypothetical protein